MIGMADSAAKGLVFAKVQRNATRPTELLILLDEGLSYADIQEAVSELLYEGRIILTSDRQLLVGPGTTRTPNGAGRDH